MAYLNAIQKIGKGTGKRAVRYRQDARAAAAMLMGAIFTDAIGRDTTPERYPYSMRQATDKYVRLLLDALGVGRAKAPARRRPHRTSP